MMRKFFRLIVAGLGGLALFACMAASAAVSYRGVLHLSGNAPFVTPVLVDEAGKRWQLDELDRDTVLRLQNQRVEVEGRPSDDGRTLVPSLKVEKIEVLPDAP